MKTFPLALLCVALQIASPARAAETPLRVIAEFPHRPTGVAVAADGRLFVCLPFSNYTDPSAFTASVVTLGPGREPEPYPDAAWNRIPSRHPDADPQTLFLNVQSLTLDDQGTLWLLDRGRPLGGDLVPGGAKLVGVDTATHAVTRVVVFPEPLAEGNFLNDVRVDAGRGVAYVTDTGNGGVIVVDLEAGAARLALEPGFTSPAEPTPIVKGLAIGAKKRASVPATADGLALSPGGETLYLQDHPWVGRPLHAVPTAALRDASLSPAEVAAELRSLGPTVHSDGIQTDAQGRVHFTDYEHDALTRRNQDGTLEVVAYNNRLSWPDAIAFGADGTAYVPNAKFHQTYSGPGGSDASEPPFELFAVPAPGQR